MRPMRHTQQTSLKRLGLDAFTKFPASPQQVFTTVEALRKGVVAAEEAHANRWTTRLRRTLRLYLRPIKKKFSRKVRCVCVCVCMLLGS